MNEEPPPPLAIGVFDSGVGGVSVLNGLRAAIPGARYLYVADHAHCPYGDRSAAEITGRADLVTGFLFDRGADVVVVACNTATVAAVEHLRARYPRPVVGTEPPVKPAAARSRNRVVGVLATSRTLDGAKFGRLVENHADGVRVLRQACPGLADRVEAGDLDGPETRSLLARFLEPMLDAGADVVVLGSTHYVFLRPLVEALAGRDVAVLDPVDGVVRRTMEIVGPGFRSTAPSGDGGTWWTTSSRSRAEVVARLAGRPVTLSVIDAGEL